MLTKVEVFDIIAELSEREHSGNADNSVLDSRYAP